MIGEKIKSLRTKNQMTQKDLADKLFVTSQAVSRWENGEVEPSISTVSEMAKIFNVTIDELVNDKKEESTDNLSADVDKLIDNIVNENKIDNNEPVFVSSVKEEPKVVEKIVYAEPPKQMLALCEKCNQPIYESSDIVRFDEKKIEHHGRHRVTNTINHLYCKSCYDKKVEEDRIEAERKERERLANIKKRRTNSYIWGGIAGGVCGLIGFFISVPVGIVLLPTVFAFTSCLIMDNNFIGDLWGGIASWSIKLPGLIFSLDLDGIIWFLTIKLLGAILSFCFSIFAVLFATSVCLIMSVFVYPFALSKSYKGLDE